MEGRFAVKGTNRYGITVFDIGTNEVVNCAIPESRTEVMYNKYFQVHPFLLVCIVHNYNHPMQVGHGLHKVYAFEYVISDAKGMMYARRNRRSVR